MEFLNIFGHSRPMEISVKMLRNLSRCIHATKKLRNFSTGLEDIKKAPTFKDFLAKHAFQNPTDNLSPPLIPYLSPSTNMGQSQKVYFEVHGCQMNTNDTEIIWSLLQNNGYVKTDVQREADVVLIVTCAIREGAEQKIWNKLKTLRGLQKQNKNLKIGVLGCMAERLKHNILERDKIVDIVAGPDSYRDLPRLLSLADNNQTGINVMLSADETYADVVPVRLDPASKTAFVSIMRGCDNMCTYCIVPFTRGRERSRPAASVVEEVRRLAEEGVKEVTLLGQNVNSYRDTSQKLYAGVDTRLTAGFRTVYKAKKGGLRFADLLDRVADVDPEMRVRFTSPHPKDFPDEVLQVIKERNNVCKSLHMPAQSGSSSVLERMRRGYTREAYLDLVDHIRNTIPNVAFCSDFICGFCGETEEEFEETISLIERVQYSNAFLFPYSMREKTTAHRRYVDDVPDEVKKARLQKMVEVYRNNVKKVHETQIGKQQVILVEGTSKRSSADLAGRNDHNVKVIIPSDDILDEETGIKRSIQPGDYVRVEITSASSQVLKGTPISHTKLSQTIDS